MNIIEKLNKIKNEKNIHDLYNLFDKIITFPIPLIPIKIPVGTKIVRCRINGKGKHFESISDLYCPPLDKTNQQRANIEKNPIFYGATFINDFQAPLPRAVVLYEISDFAKDTKSYGIQRLTYSVWIVKKELHLFALPFYQNYNNLNSKIEELEFEWNNRTKNVNFKPEQLKFIEFLSNEYAESSSDYFFTAHFTHFICNLKNLDLDGVMYPTVRLEGDGLNVAIKPETVKTKMEFTGAIECYYIKEGLQSYIINAFVAELTKSGTLTYIKQKNKAYNHFEKLINELGFIN